MLMIAVGVSATVVQKEELGFLVCAGLVGVLMIAGGIANVRRCEDGQAA